MLSRSTLCTQWKCAAMMARLIALDRADEVPLEGQMREFRDFFHGFLGVVFAERPLAGRMRLRYVLGRKGLAYRDQRDVVRPPAGGDRRAFHAGTNGLQVDGDCGHNFRIASER